MNGKEYLGKWISVELAVVKGRTQKPDFASWAPWIKPIDEEVKLYHNVAVHVVNFKLYPSMKNVNEIKTSLELKNFL